MKKVRNLIAAAKELSSAEDENLTRALYNLICYSPKIPLRLHQQQLLEEATTFRVEVYDEHFAKGPMVVNGFKWGRGSYKVLLTHGWGSKALDFVELITELRTYDDLEIIAFDAPGNGSSEGELTNLLLYMKAVIAVSARYGVPDAFIGHSLGAMANILAADELEPDNPQLLISISPLIKIKEHFVSIMRSVNASDKAQDDFFTSFQLKFNVPADHFDLVNLYSTQRKHLVLYDPDDPVSPQNYLLEFLSKNPGIESVSFDQVGHERMHRDPQVIKEVVKFLVKNRDS